MTKRYTIDRDRAAAPFQWGWSRINPTGREKLHTDTGFPCRWLAVLYAWWWTRSWWKR